MRKARRKKRLKPGAFPAGTEVAVVREFARLSALSPRTARRLSDVGLVDAPGTEALIRRQLLRPADSLNERYYLDFEHYTRIRRRRILRFAAAAFASVTLIVIVALSIVRVE